MKDRLKHFENIKTIFLNGNKQVLSFTIFDEYVSFKYQDDDGVKEECVFFKNVIETVKGKLYTVKQGFRKEGKSTYTFNSSLSITINSF